MKSEDESNDLHWSSSWEKTLYIYIFIAKLIAGNQRDSHPVNDPFRHLECFTSFIKLCTIESGLDSTSRGNCFHCATWFIVTSTVFKSCTLNSTSFCKCVSQLIPGMRWEDHPALFSFTTCKVTPGPITHCFLYSSWKSFSSIITWVTCLNWACQGSLVSLQEAYIQWEHQELMVTLQRLLYHLNSGQEEKNLSYNYL